MCHQDPVLHRHAARMRDGIFKLDYAGTFRNVLRQVSTIQWYYLYTRAILDWNTSVAPRLNTPGPHDTLSKYMGVFSHDADHAARLFDVGIPIWLFRRPQQIHADVVVRQLIDLTVPESIVMNDGEFGNVVYHGRLGLNHLEAITRHGNRSLDVDNNLYSSAAIGYYRESDGGSTVPETS